MQEGAHRPAWASPHPCRHAAQERKREKENNAVEFKHATSRPIRYGQNIQLQHMASLKYASVTRQSAELDRDGAPPSQMVRERAASEQPHLPPRRAARDP